MDGMVFSDELRDKYPEYLNSENQKLDFWITSVCHDTNGSRPPPTYDSSNGDLADVIKVLIHENQMETLLMLANHPLIPLHTLSDISLGFGIGFECIVDIALRPYIFWNFVAAAGLLASGAYKHLKIYESMVGRIAMTHSYDAELIPHWKFYGFKSGCDDNPAPTVEPAHLHEYLKHLFCLLYRYDMLLSECGVDPEWVYKMGYPLRLLFKISFKSEQDAEGGWIYYF